MSAKLIIYLSGNLLVHGYVRREFLWSEAHKCHLYGGSEIDASEFNAKYEKAMRTNADLNPRVKVVSLGDLVHLADIPFTMPSSVTPPPNIASITVAQAEEVLLQLAPERLKKKTGPKPHLAGVEV